MTCRRIVNDTSTKKARKIISYVMRRRQIRLQPKVVVEAADELVGLAIRETTELAKAGHGAGSAGQHRLARALPCCQYHGFLWRSSCRAFLGEQRLRVAEVIQVRDTTILGQARFRIFHMALVVRCTSVMSCLSIPKSVMRPSGLDGLATDCG